MLDVVQSYIARLDLFEMLIYLIGIDICSGLIKGMVTKHFKSACMKIWSKLGEVSIPVIGFMLDSLAGTNIIGYGCITFLALKNLTSIVENLREMGVPIPNIISEKIEEKSNES